MPPPLLRERVTHMLDAIAQIDAKTKNLTFDKFKADRFRQLGIERCLEIISEASRYIPDDIRAHHTDVPWRLIADIGNRLRHAYHAVDSELIWNIVTDELHDLKRSLELIMRETGT